MKIFGAMLVKDEVDILRHCVTDALRWVDALYILDNGSTDGTWESLQELRSDKVIPWKQDFTPYRRSMRAELFDAFRSESEDGDWWFVADADEFYQGDPRTFLARVPSDYHAVFKKSVDYFITEEDIAEYDFTGDFAQDRDHIRYVQPACWSEIRFFRYRKRLRWDAADRRQQQIPPRVGIWFPEPIPVRHYQYRSPMQMQARLDIRNKIPRDKQGRPFRHVVQTDWRELLKKRAELILDPGPEGYESLPLRREIREKPLTFLAKRFMYGMGIYP